MKFDYPPGATPIDPDEAAGLIPTHVRLQSELNEYEEANIVEATEWAFSRRRGDPLQATFIHAVHRRMFDKTWKWAGAPRRSDKNIGVPWPEIHTCLHQGRASNGGVARWQPRASSGPDISRRFERPMAATALRFSRSCEGRNHDGSATALSPQQR